MEPVGKSSTRPGAVSGLSRLDDALSVAEQAGGDVLLALDSYNLATAGERFEGLSRVPAARVGIAQIAGSSATSIGRALPGDGEIDNETFVEMLAGLGYRGAVSVEMFRAAPLDDPGAFAAEAYRRMTTLLGRFEDRS